MHKRLLCRMFLSAVLLLSPFPALALPQVAISSPEADGVFILNALSMEGVYGLSVTIGYDASTLANPRIVMGDMVKGLLSSANTGNPIHIAMVGTRELKGTGTIATLTFDRIADSPGSITGVSASFVDFRSKPLAMAQPLVINPSQPQPVINAGDTTATAPATTTIAGQATGRSPVVGGSLVTPQNDNGNRETTDTSQPPVQQDAEQKRLAPPAEPAAPPPDAATAQAPAPTTTEAALPPPPQITSVVERFRAFTGEKSVSSLVSLFNTDQEALVSQSPSIALSDGESTVTVLIPNIAGEKTPKFTFSNAKFVSLSHAGAGEWEVVVRPEKGAVEAAITMLVNANRYHFPLVVAPKAELPHGEGAKATEAEFLLFLKQSGTPAAPQYDLNGDGKRDYLDDYIYTANYLLQQRR